MRKIVFTFAILIFAFATQTAAAKDDWIKVKSKNFNIVGNAAEKDLRRAAAKLEQFREAFRQLFPNIKFNSPVPTTVVVFENAASLRQLNPPDRAGKTNAGYFFAGEDANYAALSAETEKGDAIYHAYAHFLLDNAVGRGKIPAWLGEGLAEYFEKIAFGADQKVTLGAANAEHLALLGRSRFIPSNAFFAADYYSLNRQEISSDGIFYAQSWALVHFLLHGAGGAQQLGAFVDLLANGKSPNAAFAEAFRTDAATLLAEVNKYAAQKTFNAATAVFKTAADAQVFPLGEAEATAIVADLLYHAGRFDAAETLLRQALKLEPNLAPATASLGLVKLRLGDRAEAKRLLKKAVALDENSALAHFRYAFVLSREGMTETGFVSGYERALADEIKSELKRSIALDPGFAESYALYAFVSAVANEDVDEALAFIEKALRVAPGNQKYLIRAAELRLRTEEFGAARAIALSVFATAPDAHLRLYAQNTLARINSTEAQLADIKNARKGASNREIESEKPLTEDEIARRNREAVNEGLNRALRRPAAGEKRILGYITRIECAAGRIEFSVKTAAQTFKFFARDFESLFLMSFSPDSADAEIGCSTVKKEIFAVVTYLPAPDAKTAFAGEIVALEFMPEGFRLQ